MGTKINIDQAFGTKNVVIAKQRTEETIFLDEVPVWDSKERTKITEKELSIIIDVDKETIKYLVYTLEDLEPAMIIPHGLKNYKTFDNKADAIKYYNEVEFIKD